MKCNKCGSHAVPQCRKNESMEVATLYFIDVQIIKYHCDKCGNRFKSVEVRMEDFNKFLPVCVQGIINRLEGLKNTLRSAL